MNFVFSILFSSPNHFIGCSCPLDAFVTRTRHKSIKITDGRQNFLICWTVRKGLKTSLMLIRSFLFSALGDVCFEVLQPILCVSWKHLTKMHQGLQHPNILTIQSTRTVTLTLVPCPSSRSLFSSPPLSHGGEGHKTVHLHSPDLSSQEFCVNCCQRLTVQKQSISSLCSCLWSVSLAQGRNEKISFVINTQKVL